MFPGGSVAGNGHGGGAAKAPRKSAPIASSAPTISGSAVAGNTLTASTGSWSGPVSSYVYQWLRCDSSGNACSSIGGTTSSSYVIVTVDVGHMLRVSVTASNRYGSGIVTSASTSVVTAPVSLSPPSNTSAPTINGTPTVGQTLTASSGTWSGSPTSYAYAWKRCGSSGGSCGDISGATSASYGLTSTDTGYTIRLTVTAINSGGSSDATSMPTSTVTTNTGVALPGPIAGLGYSEVFNEDFSNFSYNNSGSINDAYKWQRPFNGANDAGTVFVDANKVLHLKYTTATATKPVAIGTRKSVGNYQGSWTYGYFEASIAIPAGIATYPQFWLSSTPQVWGWTCSTTTQWTNGSPLLNAEIDMLEGGWEQNGWGKSGVQQYNTSTHLNTSSGCGTADQLQTHFNSSGALDGAFHTYAVLWTPSTVTLYLDGAQTASFPTPASANQPMYLILGSDVHHSYTGTLPSVSDTQVAWVHVWQK